MDTSPDQVKVPSAGLSPGTMSQDETGSAEKSMEVDKHATSLDNFGDGPVG